MPVAITQRGTRRRATGTAQKRQSHRQNRLFDNAPDQVLAEDELAGVPGLLKELPVGGGRTRRNGDA
ncbi:MAG TPA: hypothetical protein VGI28_12200 [Stellaceae bacterium]|jgi:hypothetical protein